MTRSALALALGSLALALAGCASNPLEEMRLSAEGNPGPCPSVFALADAARVVEFDGEPSLDTVAWSGEILDVRTSCRYVADRPITAAVEIDFAIGRGPAASGETHEVTYFVAVTRRDRALIAKEEFTIPVRVKDGIATVRFTDEVEEIVIPRRDEEVAGQNFEIAVGFSLTREQLLYNRSGDSLKFPETNS